MNIVWDWESLLVVRGGYWLLLVAVLLVLVAALAGYAIAMSVAHKRFNRWQSGAHLENGDDVL